LELTEKQLKTREYNLRRRSKPGAMEEAREYTRKYYQAHKEHYSEYWKRPEVLARKQKRRQTPEVIAKRREYNARPETKERKRKYRKTQKDMSRQLKYRLENKGKRSAWESKRRADKLRLTHHGLI